MDLGVEVAHAHVHQSEVVRQVFGHAFGEGGDEHALLARHPDPNFLQQIVHLSPDGPNDNFGIQQAGGTDHLFHDHALAFFQLVIRGRGGCEDRLVDHGLEFLEIERPVIERGGEPESVFHQHLFAGSVPGEHAPDLRNRHMGFVHKEQKIFGKIVHKRIGALARFPAGEIAGVILDPGAVSDFLHHLHVEFSAGFEALGFQ